MAAGRTFPSRWLAIPSQLPTREILKRDVKFVEGAGNRSDVGLSRTLRRGNKNPQGLVGNDFCDLVSHGLQGCFGRFRQFYAVRFRLKPGVSPGGFWKPPPSGRRRNDEGLASVCRRPGRARPLRMRELPPLMTVTAGCPFGQGLPVDSNNSLSETFHRSAAARNRQEVRRRRGKRNSPANLCRLAGLCGTVSHPAVLRPCLVKKAAAG